MTTVAPEALRLTLRDYQVEALARSDAAEARGVRRQLGVAATGLGLTIVFAEKARRRGGRSIVLVHRDELVVQSIKKLLEVWPDLGASSAALGALYAAGDTWLATTTPCRENGVGIVKAGAGAAGLKQLVQALLPAHGSYSGWGELALARRLNIKVNPSWRAGELSDAIDARFQEFEERRKAKAHSA